MQSKKISTLLTVLALSSPLSLPLAQAQNDSSGTTTTTDVNNANNGADRSGLVTSGNSDGRGSAATGDTTGASGQDANQYAQQEQRVGEETGRGSPFLVALLIVAAIALIGYAMRSSRRKTHI